MDGALESREYSCGIQYPKKNRSVRKSMDGMKQEAKMVLKKHEQ